MARGNTRLLTWGANTLRLFELDNTGVFVQLGSVARSAVFVYDKNPYFDFLPDGDFAYQGNSNATARNVSLHISDKQTLADVTPLDMTSSASSSPFTSSAKIFSYKNKGIQYVEVASSANSNLRYEVNALGGLTSRDSVLYTYNSWNFVDFSAIALSHDLQMIFHGRSNATGAQGARVATASVFGSVTGLPTSWQGNIVFFPTTTVYTYALFTNDDRFLIAGRLGGFDVFRRSGVALVKLAPVIETGLTVRCIRAHMNNRLIAVSYTGGASTYITKLYRRTGDTYSLIQTINDFGNILDFSPDGKLLIDAGSLKAYEDVAGVWTDRSATMMVNVAAGAQKQAIGPYLINPTMIGSLYDGALSFFINHMDDLSGLKLALLNGNALFSSVEDSAADVLVNEVYGNNWPKGGVALSNVAGSEPSTGRFVVNCAPVSQLIFNGDLTVRYALLYKDNMPLIFYDFQDNRTFLANTLVNFGTGENGLVLFSA